MVDCSSDLPLNVLRVPPISLSSSYVYSYVEVNDILNSVNYVKEVLF